MVQSAMVVAAQGGGQPPINLAQLLLVLVVAWTAGRLASRVGYPSILGELLAGILLGPAVIGLLRPAAGLEAIGELGIILMMLYIGMEIDPRDLRRASVPGLLAAAGGFLVPFGLGYVTVLLFGGTVLEGLFVGISVGVTSLATKSRILVDLRLLDTRIAYVLMAAALLSDTATLVIFAAIIGFVEVGAFDIGGTVLVAAEVVGFFAVTAVLGLLVVPWITRRLRAAAMSDRALDVAIVLSVGLGFAELAELAGLHAILGAFVAGMYLREGVLSHRATHAVSQYVRDISIGFLAPVFFVTVGFEITLDVFDTDLALLVSIIAVATLGKVVGTALFYLPTGHGLREGLTVGAAMNGRGAVEIIVAGIGLELGLISTEVFTILVFMAIATTASVPVLLKLGVEWLRRHGELARSEERRRGVVIVGAGPVARALAHSLMPSRPVTLIDTNPTVTGIARREGLRAITADALHEEELRRSGMDDAGTLLALTTNFEVNVLAAQRAREDFLVPNVRVALGATMSEALGAIVDEVGAEPMLDAPVDVGQWDQLLRGNRARIDTLHVDDDTDAEALLERLRAGRSVFPLTVVRDHDRIPFVLVDELLPGDRVVVVHRVDQDERQQVLE
ncbi:MAG: cation:proton antiporter [Actinobacteria bacterium]|nr:cation:proton antiporter [Actinomycetota bacterium]